VAADARATLEAGFTTVRDVENEGSWYADVALRDAIIKDWWKRHGCKWRRAGSPLAV
jgi:hypothetical protein